MSARICKTCGCEIEPERPLSAKKCFKCSELDKHSNGAVAWCKRWANDRRRKSAMRRVDLDTTVDAAVIVYQHDTRDYGLCVVEWRGTAPSALKHIHA